MISQDQDCCLVHWVVVLFHECSDMNVRGFAFLVMIKKWPCLVATGTVYFYIKGTRV